MFVTKFRPNCYKMSKRIRDYVKYSLSELENYIVTEESCVKKVESLIHLNFPPYGLGNFKQTLLHIIAKKKIGFFDSRVQGIILDVRNIKVINDTGAMRFDDPAIHLDIKADCYVFQPKIGAVARGIVKHISPRQIGVTIYRVFSVSIRLRDQVNNTVEINSVIEFKIIKFDLQSVMPYIEGELVAKEISKQDSIKVSVDELDLTNDVSTESSDKAISKVKSEDKNEIVEPRCNKPLPESSNNLTTYERDAGNSCKKKSGQNLKFIEKKAIINVESDESCTATTSTERKHMKKKTTSKKLIGKKNEESDDIFSGLYEEENVIEEIFLSPRNNTMYSQKNKSVENTPEEQKSKKNCKFSNHVLNENNEKVDTSLTLNNTLFREVCKSETFNIPSPKSNTEENTVEKRVTSPNNEHSDLLSDLFEHDFEKKSSGFNHEKEIYLKTEVKINKAVQNNNEDDIPMSHHITKSSETVSRKKKKSRKFNLNDSVANIFSKVLAGKEGKAETILANNLETTNKSSEIKIFQSNGRRKGSSLNLLSDILARTQNETDIQINGDDEKEEFSLEKTKKKSRKRKLSFDVLSQIIDKTISEMGE